MTVGELRRALLGVPDARRVEMVFTEGGEVRRTRLVSLRAVPPALGPAGEPLFELRGVAGDES